ncbi:MAG TPA: LuxR family transcriptional regulator [Steroidobacteraceae bacterium]|nr:LuxR family transcriptional regulator [Steroidobacteraceae bacterium]
MNQLDVIRGFLELAETGAPSIDRLAGEFLKAIQCLGFRHFACCSHVDPFHPPAETVMLHNYPRGWVRTYSEAKLYEIDPVLKRAESTPLSFFWDTAFHSAPITKSQNILMADAAGYGITHGYTMPLHLSWLPGTVRASCTVIPDCGSIDPQNYVSVEVLARYLHFFATRAHAPWLAAAHVELTPRERQCLALVALGKSDWTIGRVLSLGESTVHYHIERVKRRLRVATRTQAVVQAVMSGQISFGDVFRKAADGDTRSDSSSHANLH